MPHQEALTLVAAVNPARKNALESLMAELGSDPAANAVLPFGALPGCHFARVVMLPESRDPIAGGARGNQFSLAGTPTPERCLGLPRFVSVVGGAYFFLPSLRALTFLSELGT